MIKFFIPHRISNTNSCISITYLYIYGLIIDPHNAVFPVALRTQLVEHCNDIAEVRIQVPYRPFFHYGLTSRAKLQRSLALKLFSSTIQTKFHSFDCMVISYCSQGNFGYPGFDCNSRLPLLIAFSFFLHFHFHCSYSHNFFSCVKKP